MKRRRDAPRLRLRLARLVSTVTEKRSRRQSVYALANRIAERTGQPVSAVIRRACREAAEIVVARALCARTRGATRRARR